MDREQTWLHKDERFIVRKNTLPYVHQWAVLDTKTGDKVGDYKTWPLAMNACLSCNKYWPIWEKEGLPSSIKITSPGIGDAWSAASKRMKRPDGDLPPKSPELKTKHSNKRRVELD